MDNYEVAFKEGNVWIMFKEEPNLDDLQQARQLLDRLTDLLILEKFYAPIPTK